MKPDQYNILMPRVTLENLKLINLNELVRLIGNNLKEFLAS